MEWCLPSWGSDIQKLWNPRALPGPLSDTLAYIPLCSHQILSVRRSPSCTSNYNCSLSYPLTNASAATNANSRARNKPAPILSWCHIWCVNQSSFRSARLTPTRRHLRIFHLSSRAAPRAHGIPHHTQLSLRLSRTTILPPNSALHLLRRPRPAHAHVHINIDDDAADQARPIPRLSTPQILPRLLRQPRRHRSLRGNRVPHLGIPARCHQARFSLARRASPPRDSPRRYGYRRTRGCRGADGLVSVRGRASAHANWRADAARALVALGRDCARYLGAWWATGFLCWIEHWIPQDRAYERCQLCGLAGHEKVIRCLTCLILDLTVKQYTLHYFTP